MAAGTLQGNELDRVSFRMHLAAEVTIKLLIALLLAGVILGCQDARSETETDPAIVFQQLRSDDLETRRAAVGSLVDLASSPEGDQAIRENLGVLARIIGDQREDPEVRGQTVRAIATVSERKQVEQKNVPMLIEILLDETESETVRSWIAMTLPDLAPPEVAAPAILAAGRSENLAVRTNASQQVSRLRLAPADLLTWLRRGIKDPDTPVRMATVVAAAELARRDKRALAVLLRGVNDPEPVVRRAAVELLTVEGVLSKDDLEQGRAAIEEASYGPEPEGCDARCCRTDGAGTEACGNVCPSGHRRAAGR